MPGRVIEIAVARQVDALTAPNRRDLTMAAGEALRLALTVYERDGDAAPLNLAGMGAYFSFGDCWGVGGNGTFESFDGGRVYFDLIPEATACWGPRIPWQVMLGPVRQEAMVCSGIIAVTGSDMRLDGSSTILGTSDGNILRAGNGVLGASDGLRFGNCSRMWRR